MSLGGVGREEGAGRRGTAGVAGGTVAGRIVQTDPLSTVAWCEFSWDYLEISKQLSSKGVRGRSC